MRRRRWRKVISRRVSMMLNYDFLMNHYNLLSFLWYSHMVLIVLIIIHFKTTAYTNASNEHNDNYCH
jgi:hypothetical protein